MNESLIINHFGETKHIGPWKKNLQKYKEPIIETYSESGWWNIVMDQRKKHLVDWVEI